jgi:hypothetical protein
MLFPGQFFTFFTQTTQHIILFHETSSEHNVEKYGTKKMPNFFPQKKCRNFEHLEICYFLGQGSIQKCISVRFQNLENCTTEFLWALDRGVRGVFSGASS